MRRTSVDNYYECFNPNPLNKETGDCVFRALCAVTGLSWYEVFDRCCKIARENGTIPNSGDKSFVLIRAKEFGLEPRTIPRPKKGQKSITVQDFCKQHPVGKFILSTADHNVGVVDGKYYDLYPNYGQKVYKYYEVIQ